MRKKKRELSDVSQKKGVLFLAAAKKRARARGKSRETRVVVKKPISLAFGKPEAMIANSALVIYWLALFALVVLGMLAAAVVGIVQIVVPDNRVLVIVAVFGLFFGYVANNLLGLVEHLEARHHFFARIFVPLAAVLNLFLVSSAANSLAFSVGVPSFHSPIAVSLVFALALAAPFLVSRAMAQYGGVTLG